MEQVKIFHDRTGNTLTVWFGNPQEECVWTVVPGAVARGG
jgi:hypothetical protein